VLQYWLRVALVLRGLPGRLALPRDHWDRMVRLAEDVVVGGAEGEADVQLVTGWCSVDEPLGDGKEGEENESESER
jgi:hypothetical protein